MNITFDQNFLIPHLMEDNDYTDQVISTLTPEHFQDPHRTVLKIIKDHRETYPGKTVSKDVLLTELDNGRYSLNQHHYDHVKELIHEVPAANGVDRTWLLNKTTERLRDTAYMAELSKAIETKNRDKRAEHLQRAIEAQHFTFNKETLFMETANIFDSYTPPKYLIQNLFKQGYLYGMTGATGSGKTAVALSIAKSVARSENIGDRQVHGGRVIYFAGENPDDVQARCIAQLDRHDDIRMFPYPCRPHSYGTSHRLRLP